MKDNIVLFKSNLSTGKYDYIARRILVAKVTNTEADFTYCNRIHRNKNISKN